MIDFGLDTCPLCGCAANMDKLEQSAERLYAEISCTGCGLRLEWETDIRVGVGTDGGRHPQQIGIGPVEAWNRRHEPALPGSDDPTLTKALGRLHRAGIKGRDAQIVYMEKEIDYYRGRIMKLTAELSDARASLCDCCRDSANEHGTEPFCDLCPIREDTREEE